MSTPAFALAFLLATAPAAADTDGHGDTAKCPMHDATATEADRAKHLDEMFGKLDADGNGSIDREEFRTHHEDMRREHRDDDAAVDHGH